MNERGIDLYLPFSTIKKGYDYDYDYNTITHMMKIFDVDCVSVIFEFNFSPFDLKMEIYLNIVCLFFPLS